VPLIAQGKDREDFADYYAYATDRSILFYMPAQQIGARRRIWACTAPVTYTGGDELAREIAYLKEAAGTEDTFLTSTAPASLEVYFLNEYYDDPDEYLYALADALAVEYKAIADSGVILQVDDAWLPALWDRIGMQMGMDAFRDRCRSRVEALNHALKGIPEDRVRYHLCWGSWKGPHAYDLELKDIVDIMLEVKAGAYLIEGANVRHEHEYAVWDDVKLPDGKILIPGIVTHSTDNIEHPELVAQRIRRFADRVGKENVIAGCDCGFGGRSHPQIAWAKLKSLAAGAALVK
jgi:5-methyltetrahydropteroyltriglutamate--homocysteine methyltransferase